MTKSFSDQLRFNSLSNPHEWSIQTITFISLCGINIERPQSYNFYGKPFDNNPEKFYLTEYTSCLIWMQWVSLVMGGALMVVHFCDSLNHASQMVHTQCGTQYVAHNMSATLWFHSSTGNATEHDCLWRLNLSRNTRHAMIITNWMITVVVYIFSHFN